MAIPFIGYQEKLKKKQDKKYQKSVEEITKAVELGFDEAIERCQSKIIFAYPLFEKAVDISLFDDVVYNLNQVYKEQGWGGVKIKSFRGSHVVFSLKIPE
jgi:hypothetical protein